MCVFVIVVPSITFFILIFIFFSKCLAWFVVLAALTAAPTVHLFYSNSFRRIFWGLLIFNCILYSVPTSRNHDHEKFVLIESIILLFWVESNQTEPSRKLLMILNHFIGKTSTEYIMLKTDFLDFSFTLTYSQFSGWWHGLFHLNDTNRWVVLHHQRLYCVGLLWIRLRLNVLVCAIFLRYSQLVSVTLKPIIRRMRAT